jgi:hypothetical protein
VGGEARYVFRRLDVDGDGGGEGGKAEEAKMRKEGEKKGKWWWLKRKVRIRKVRRDQRGLGPRLRVARCAVGAKARFRAQCAIPHYMLGSG